MLVEATIFGGERRLDQVVGELIERDRVIVSDAAGADFVTIAVQEGYRELGLFEPVVIRGFTEGGDGERQHDQQAPIAQGQALRQRLHERPAPPARDMEPVHQDGEALVKLPSPGLGLVQAEVDPGIEIEQEAAQPDLPADPIVAVLEEVAQDSGFPRSGRIAPAGRALNHLAQSSTRSRGSKLWRHQSEDEYWRSRRLVD